MLISINPLGKKDGCEGFAVECGERHLEVFGNTRAAAVSGVKALVASEMLRAQAPAIPQEKSVTPAQHTNG